MELTKAKEWIASKRILLVSLAASGLAAGVSAADINLTEITNVIQAIVGIVPDLIDLVVGIVPIIVVIALVGFIVAFFDKILGMLRIK